VCEHNSAKWCCSHFGNEVGVREEGSQRRRHCAGESAQPVERNSQRQQPDLFGSNGGKDSAPREFQSRLERSPVPGGRIGHPPMSSFHILWVIMPNLL
jgi:hypothetical protein